MTKWLPPHIDEPRIYKFTNQVINLQNQYYIIEQILIIVRPYLFCLICVSYAQMITLNIPTEMYM